MNAEPRRRIVRVLLALALAHVVVLGALFALATPVHGQSEVHAAAPVRAPVAVPAATPVAPVEWGGVLDLQTRLKDVRVEATPAGDVVVVKSPRGELRLTPEQFAGHLRDVQEEQRKSGMLFVFLNITTPIGFIWVAVGFLGQALFTLRMVLQWYASEKERRSVIPVGFWWGSLFGGLLLLVYFVWRKDVVGILGQSTGVVVYARNLILIHRARAADEHAQAAAPVA